MSAYFSRAEATTAGSRQPGTEAIAAIETFDPDVVFTDLMLPDLDGCELARRLRQRANSPYLVALTAWADQRERARAHTLFDEYVIKPAGAALLGAVLERAHRH